MAHHIYHTTALILLTKERGEANKRVTLLTRELGLVHAIAQGIRYEKSKLRFALQELSLARVDLVRGRDVWRITSAQSIHSFASECLVAQKKNTTERVIGTILRFYLGEDVHETVFDLVLRFLQAMEEEIEKENYISHEVYTLFRVLCELGYCTVPNSARQYEDNFSHAGIAIPETIRTQMILEINRAFKESHL